MQFVTSRDGTKIAFEREGTGPALIIVTGALASSHSAWVPQLAGILAPHFTVFMYDRRGKGESGDTQPYAVEREIEDLETLIDEAGGKAFVYGHSSGAALALQAAVRPGSRFRRLALYEAPYNDDPPAIARWKIYINQLTRLLADGKKGEAVALFMQYLGTPAVTVERMRKAPFWPALEAAGNTLVYDHLALLGDDGVVPKALAAELKIPTLVMAGGAGFPFMRETARTLGRVIPGAQFRILDGQTHEVSPRVLAPVLAEFFR